MLTTREGSAVVSGGPPPSSEDPIVVAGSGGVVKVKMKVQLVGSHPGTDGNSVAWPDPGTELEIDDAQGAKLVKAGLASPVAVKDADVETATVKESSEKRGGGGTTKKFMEDED